MEVISMDDGSTDGAPDRLCPRAVRDERNALSESYKPV